ncbi:MAG TPA: hypothetical protein VJW77_08810 [Terriglobia bacterium]|nr:hypothetical protein [Terriglobia bacterium]HKT11910.1 hypothetical protein [Terriglobia bacterium]
MELDDNFKKLIKELGQAINESLADSDNISEVMGRIRGAGYDLFLVLEVTIGFNKEGQSGTVHQKELTAETDVNEPGFLLTTEDAKFLRSLKIVVEQDKE